MLKIKGDEVDILLELQNIEDESTGIRRSLSKVDEEIRNRRKKLEDSQKELALLEDSLGKIKKEYRDYEIEFETRNTRLKKSEEYIKTVSSNSEYQILLREIDDNRKKNAELEGQMLELLDRIETGNKEVEEGGTGIEQIRTEVEKEIAEIEATSVDDRKALEGILKKRDDVASRLDPKLYRRFSGIINKAGGKGIVPVTNSICGGCYMNIPPQMYIEVQRGENIYFCPQCHRMLYYKE